MNCLDFPNNYFDKAVVAIQGSFTRDIRNTCFKNYLEGCFGNLNLIYIGRIKETLLYCFMLRNNSFKAFSSIRENPGKRVKESW